MKHRTSPVLVEGPMPLMAPAVIFLALFFLVPLGYVIWMSLSQPVIGLQNFGRLLNSSLFASVLYNTFKTALLVTLLSLLFAYPLAYAAANGSKRFATFLLTVVALSFWTSYLVRTYAWMVILGNQGPVTALLSWFGWDPTPKILFTTFSATLAMTHALIPFMTMSLFAVMKRIDPLYVRAAENLGAHPFRAFVFVYLPLSAPGIVNGCTLVFITCLGFYVMPVLLGSPRDQMIAGIIGDQIEQTLDFGLGSAISIVLLALTLAVYALYNRFFGLDRLWAGGDR
ncbi:ABC transporter permease [Sinorhizobium meliloti]|uniref:ABC transporter permease n=1 Tax=Rhizobium meliloti TaxID=382 RepID=UPI000C9C4287|nr:ABC transporter permease [Sinorhizobium meliloti]MDW9372899.1 ABC transporter permease subunit [Sinorhizobium meliloti]MDW9789520.1 ABC transporter permease subunit [Sinorhizobium meliloti]MDW9858839.1 ABC transporter permease subunit [Sinorhizobium meliloti]MDW9963678.1 ABC transporter permease subunit [Sinorhizobium meliloti]MDX0057134.1 ABC transporter permease subunit [Sinorhizobium meliloti]